MSVFTIPSGVVHDIEALFRNFLWSQGDDSRGKCRVAWKDVCKPLSNGGLGIRRLACWNRALLMKHVWDFTRKRQSLWIRWCYSNYFGNTQFWLIKHKPSWSWVVRKILDLRTIGRRFFVNDIGDGLLTHAWEDTWLPIGHLSTRISYRMIRAAGLGKDSVTRDVVSRFQDGWPADWVERLPGLRNNPIPSLISTSVDVVKWKGLNGEHLLFSVQNAWRSLDGQRPNHNWCKAIWFKGCVPKFSFCCWIAFLKKHPTQDKIVVWKHNPPDLKCPLCEQCIDSHNHLFFECTFALEVWTGVKTDAGMEHFADSWESITQGISDGSCFPKRLSQRLAFTATVYQVWQERNRRLFDSRRRTTMQIGKEIREAVTNRLAWKIQARRKYMSQ